MKPLLALIGTLAAVPAFAGVYPPGEGVKVTFAPDGAAVPIPPNDFAIELSRRIDDMNPATPPERAARRNAILKRIAEYKSQPHTPERDLAQSADLIRVGRTAEAIRMLRGIESATDFRPTANTVQAHALSGDWTSALESHDYSKPMENAATTPEQRWHFAIEKKYVPIWLRYHREMTRNKPDATTLKPIPFFPEGPLPPDAVAILQQMALDAPTDLFLVWALADVTARTGDVRTAEKLFDRCTNSGLTQPKALMARRAEVLDAVAKLPKVEEGALLTPVEPPEPRPQGLFDLVTPRKFYLLTGTFAVVAVVLLALQARKSRRRRLRRRKL